MAETTRGRRIFTQSGIRSNLERLNRDVTGARTWGQMYGAADLMGQQATAGLNQEYSNAMNEAYMSSLQNQSAIMASNVGTGYKDYAVQSLDDALTQAYNTYLQNYVEGQAQAAENADKYRQSIVATANAQADYVKRYEQAHYDYLTQLWKMHEEGTLAADGYYDPFSNEVNWSKYITGTMDSGERLMTENELRSQFFDDQGNLTTAGIDFYEQMEQAMAQKDDKVYSFMDYLSETKDYEDLPEWVTGQYNYSYDPSIDESTTGQSMFNTLFGRASNDTVYSFAERKFGMNKGQLSLYSASFKSAADEAKQLIKDNASGKDVSAALDKVLHEYQTLAKQFGVSDSSMKDTIDALKSAYGSADWRNANLGTMSNSKQGEEFIKYIQGGGGKKKSDAIDAFNAAIAAYLKEVS